MMIGWTHLVRAATAAGNRVFWASCSARHLTGAFGVLLMVALASRGTLAADLPVPQWFDIDARGGGPNKASSIQPWRRVPLDPQYGGAWVVAGDLTGDGAAEIVSARNVDRRDVHYTSAVVAQRLDGTVLWRYGDPEIGRKELHHDVACQVYDLTADGRPEVVIATRSADGIDSVVVLEGASGRPLRRWPVTKEATDCLVFANLSGKPSAGDVLVKTRYSRISAYSPAGTPLWSVAKPGGYRTAHQPVPFDLTGNGRDQVMAGYALLDPDGQIRWTLNSAKIELGRGHLDACRVVRRGQRPEEWRLAVTYCGANGLAMIDGSGRTVWEVSGRHFESIHVGRVGPNHGPLQLAVDIAHHPKGEGPLWVFDETGRLLARIMTEHSRHHLLLDWTGDGHSEIVVAQGVFDHRGRRVATLALPDGVLPWIVMAGDMTGDGVPDLMLTTRQMSAVYIYENRQGANPCGWLAGARGGRFMYEGESHCGDVLKSVPLGTGTNFTLY